MIHFTMCKKLMRVKAVHNYFCVDFWAGKQMMILDNLGVSQWIHSGNICLCHYYFFEIHFLSFVSLQNLVQKVPITSCMKSFKNRFANFLHTKNMIYCFNYFYDGKRMIDGKFINLRKLLH